MRMRVQCLALHSELRILHAPSCSLGRGYGSDPKLLWLWHRPAAAAPIQPLAWELPYVAGMALKRKKIILCQIKVLRIKYETQNCIRTHKITLLGFYFILFCFLGPHPRHMEVPRLGGQLELQLWVYARATATKDPNHIYSLHHSSRQCWIFNPLSKTRDRIHVFRGTSQACYCWATMETPCVVF